MSSPDFTKEARELLAAMGYGPHPDEDVTAIAEALRAAAERAWNEGLRVGGARFRYELGEAQPPNPYTKPTEGER